MDRKTYEEAMEILDRLDQVVDTALKQLKDLNQEGIGFAKASDGYGLG